MYRCLTSPMPEETSDNNNWFYLTFNNTGIWTTSNVSSSCSVVNTPYSNLWDGHIACEPTEPYECIVDYPAPGANGCSGATYLDDGVCKPCPTGYDYDTTNGKTDISQCQIYCYPGTYLATENAEHCTRATNGYYALGRAVNYGSTSTPTQCNNEIPEHSVYSGPGTSST